MGTIKLPRRTFLRGLGGTVVGLPLLEAMLDSTGRAHADGTGDVPCRYVVTFGGFTMGADGDASPNGVVPSSTGPGYELLAGTQPFATHGVADEISIVSGLDIPVGNGSSNVATGGRNGGDSFHFHPNPMLTGNGQVGGVFGTTVTGPSSDQIVADAIGDGTTFRSLPLRVQALFYNQSGGIDIPANRDTLSFQDEGGGVINPIPPYSSPRQAYDALFTGFVPNDPAEAAAKAFLIEKRKSALDLVDRRMAGMLERLGAADKQRLERHFDEVRALENRLDAIPPDQTGACDLLADPGEDPPLGGEPATPSAWNVNLGYSDEDTRAAVMTDLLHMALTCDLTRSATLMYTMWQSFMNIHPLTGQSWNHHIMHHQGATSLVNEMINWHFDHFARLIAKLRDTPEGDGTVLDNCAIVFLIEGGHGADPKFGQPWSSHTTENMATLVAGGAGGLTRGEHIVAPPTANHPCNVLLTAMKAVGVDAGSIGEVSGTIDTLLP
ncbi:MAG: DUF1552 domain-containing protein [Myxococcota bacterium]